jgi:transposase
MPNPYSRETRERVIARVVASGASRREAAEHFEISASASVKWLQRWHDTGSSTAKPRGGSMSPLEKHAKWLLALIARRRPDLTLDEMFAAMRKQGIPGSRTALSRFFDRHEITFKKRVCARLNKNEPTSPGHADAGFDGNVGFIRAGWCFSMRPPSIPRWCG